MAPFEGANSTHSEKKGSGLDEGSSTRRYLDGFGAKATGSDNVEKLPAPVVNRGRLLRVLLFALLGLGVVVFNCWSAQLETDEYENSLTTFTLVKDAVSTSSAPAAASTLEVFQVYQPVLTPAGITDETVLRDGSENTTAIIQSAAGADCQVLLMDHSFGYSYGIPFVGNYTPPNCKFNRVTMNFTVTSKGRQFDRLAIMYFGDAEVWRTSTAEPTVNGIRWEYVKDMTEYMYFWDSPQKLIFDLGNLIDSTYTGFFNTTLTATFFNSQETVEPASLIIPISARRGAESAASMFTLPSDNATNTIDFPRNVNRAVFAVSACGQATEEFWWGNVLQSDINTFVPYDGTLYGYSPFREVQILIDGQLAGVQWPFPVIFTGGVVPGLWRPIVGIDAFDLREHEIDITPWLPLLCDGAQHTFEIRVVGINDDGKASGTLTETVGSSWYVTGKIFVWLDSDSTSITTGRAPTLLLPSPVIGLSHHLKQDANGTNITLEYTTSVSRTLSISALVKSQSTTSLSTWTQSLSTTNYGLYTLAGAIQFTSSMTSGTDQSTGPTYYKNQYSYPLTTNTSYLVQPSGNFSIDATLTRGLSLSVYGSPTFPTGLQPFTTLPQTSPLISSFSGTHLATTQNGSAHYFGSPSASVSSGYGSTQQAFSFEGLGINGGVDRELYFRNVTAVNGSVTRDTESLVGSEVGSYEGPSSGLKQQVFSGTKSPKEVLGRGPGIAQEVLVQAG